MKTYWRLLKLMAPYKLWMLGGMLVALLALLANMTLLAVSGWFIASMALAGAAGISMNYFSPAAVIRFSAILRTAGRYAERLLTHEATFRLLAAIRLWFYQKLEPLVPAVTDQYRSGDLFSRIQADIDSLNDFYIRILLPIVVAAIGTLAVFLVVAQYALSVASVLVLLMLLGGVVLPIYTTVKGQQPGRRLIEYRANLRTRIIDGIQGLGELIVSGSIEQQSRQIADASHQVIEQESQLNKLSALSLSGMTLFSSLAVWLVLWLAIPLVGESQIAPAELAMLALLALAAFEAVMPLPDAMRLMGQVRMAAERLFELVDHPPVIQEPQTPLPLPRELNWEFRHVSFAYEANQPVLEDITLQIGPGENIVVIGPTGAGKSSLLQLLLRQRKPQQGQVLLADHNLLAYSHSDLTQLISVVMQQVYVFNSTLRENLVLGHPQASDDEIEKVLEIVGLTEFVQQLPEGLDTWTGELGTRLSGGQLRRLAIARALLKPHSLLVLDEPTESLDAVSARQLMNNLLTHDTAKSTLMITHQLQFIDEFDRVVLMENGRIVDQGTPVDIWQRHQDFMSLLATT